MATISAMHIAAYAKLAGFPQSDLATMVAIALAESGGNTTATSSTNDHGLWQINRDAWSGLFEKYNWRLPGENAKMAYEVYQRQGLTAWVTYDNGAYRQHLGKAVTAVRQLSTQSDSWWENALDFVNPIPEAAGVAGSAIGGFIEPFRELISFITDRSNWFRVGMFWLGLLLLGFGAYLTLQTTSVGREVTRTATRNVKGVVNA